MITRAVLLNIIALSTTLLFGVFVVYWERDGVEDEIYFVYVLWAIDMTMNCICLFLVFSFAGGIYRKCCGLCHGCCQSMAEYLAERLLARQQMDELTMSENLGA